MPVKIEFIYIEAGSFPMGSNDGYSDEKPIHDVRLDAFEISKYPITNYQYKQYVDDAAAQFPRLWDADGNIPRGKEDHPVVGITQDEMQSFCKWLSKKLDRDIRLPTEEEWEYVASAKGTRVYPWGDEPPDDSLLNYANNVGDTTPVDKYPKGATKEGVMDMAGNVWERTSSIYREYPNADKK